MKIKTLVPIAVILVMAEGVNLHTEETHELDAVKEGVKRIMNKDHFQFSHETEEGLWFTLEEGIVVPNLGTMMEIMFAAMAGQDEVKVDYFVSDPEEMRQAMTKRNALHFHDTFVEAA